MQRGEAPGGWGADPAGHAASAGSRVHFHAVQLCSSTPSQHLPAFRSSSPHPHRDERSRLGQEHLEGDMTITGPVNVTPRGRKVPAEGASEGSPDDSFPFGLGGPYIR